jgi:hypothetical protein
MARFDPDIVHECALECIGKPKPQMFDAFAKALDKRYPKVLDFKQPWIYSIAGGAMIQMTLYYASLTEYIMIWGTPVGSEGHSGRHFTGFWDTVIDGEYWIYGEGEFEKRVCKPGDHVYVGPGQARGMNWPNGVYAVEYARGFIPFSTPFGIAEEILICRDYLTAVQTLGLYTDLVSQYFGLRARVLKPVTKPISWLAHKVTMKLQPPPEVKEIPKKNIRWFW